MTHANTFIEKWIKLREVTVRFSVEWVWLKEAHFIESPSPLPIKN